MVFASSGRTCIAGNLKSFGRRRFLALRWVFFVLAACTAMMLR